MDSALQLPGMSTNNGGPSALVKRAPAPQGSSNLTLRRRRQRQRRSLKKTNKKIQDLQAILNRSPEALRRIEAEVAALQAKLVAHPLTSTTVVGPENPPAIQPVKRHLPNVESTRIERRPGNTYPTESRRTVHPPSSSTSLGQKNEPAMQSLKRQFKDDVDGYGNAEIIKTEPSLDRIYSKWIQPLGTGEPKPKKMKTEVPSSNNSVVKDEFESYLCLSYQPFPHTAPASRSINRLKKPSRDVIATTFHQAPLHAPETAPKPGNPSSDAFTADRNRFLLPRFRLPRFLHPDGRGDNVSRPHALGSVTNSPPAALSRSSTANKGKKTISNAILLSSDM